MAGRPLWFVFAALFVIVMARSHLFYWLGRGVYSGAAHLADQAVPGAPAADAGTAADATAAAGPAAAEDDPRRGAALRARAQRIVQTRTARRGLALVHRWGPLAVTFAYVTVGVQTAVFVGAGLLRMPYLRFVVASVPGSVAWSAIWGTVGLGVVWGAVGLAARSPWALAGVVALVAVVVAVAVRRHRAGRRHASGEPAATDLPADRASRVA